MAPTIAATTLGPMTRLASVYPLVTTRALARPFTYEVPDEVEEGAVVEVRLGGARQRGVVVETGVEAPRGVETATVGRTVDLIPPALVELALWIADYYGSTPGRALALVAPLKRARRAEKPPPGPRESLGAEPPPERLSPEQERAVERIVSGLDAGRGGNLLLYGATGSGKTEVYLRACEAALARGLGAIVLVPEIALTPQALGRFRARFGDGVALLHSGLSEAERRDERERVAPGDARGGGGAPAAVFAPARG